MPPPPPTPAAWPADTNPTPPGLKLEVKIDPPEQTVLEGELVEFECTTVALVRLEVKNPICPSQNPSFTRSQPPSPGCERREKFRWVEGPIMVADFSKSKSQRFTSYCVF